MQWYREDLQGGRTLAKNSALVAFTAIEFMGSFPPLEMTSVVDVVAVMVVVIVDVVVRDEGRLSSTLPNPQKKISHPIKKMLLQHCQCQELLPGNALLNKESKAFGTKQMSFQTLLFTRSKCENGTPMPYNLPED